LEVGLSEKVQEQKKIESTFFAENEKIFADYFGFGWYFIPQLSANVGRIFSEN
jgi:hypothetical protein